MMGYGIRMMEVRNGSASSSSASDARSSREAGAFPGYQSGSERNGQYSRSQSGASQSNRQNNGQSAFQQNTQQSGVFSRTPVQRGVFLAWPVRGEMESRRLSDSLRRVPGLIAADIVPVASRPGTVEVRITSREAISADALTQAARGVGVQFQVSAPTGR